MASGVRINEPAYQLVFESPNGIVGRDLDRRAKRVEEAAKAQVGVETGSLRRSIKRTWTKRNGKRLSVAVGSNSRHAAVHHDGSKPHVIRARNAKALRFESDSGDVTFAKTVNHPGTRPNRYLTDNLPLAVR